MKKLTPKKLYYAQLLAWLALAVTLFCYASHLEKENRVREYPNEDIADELQLREMELYHVHETNGNLIFFD